MANISCGLVHGIGVASENDFPQNPYMFTEIAIPETVTIPSEKPDMEQLISVAVDAKVISTRLVKSAVSATGSDEGQKLTGFKLIVELKLRQKVKYVADEPTQSVHAAHFEKIISSIYVVVDACTAAAFNRGDVAVIPFIEDIYAVKTGKRTIFKNIIVFLNVKVV